MDPALQAEIERIVRRYRDAILGEPETVSTAHVAQLRAIARELERDVTAAVRRSSTTRRVPAGLLEQARERARVRLRRSLAKRTATVRLAVNRSASAGLKASEASLRTAAKRLGPRNRAAVREALEQTGAAGAARRQLVADQIENGWAAGGRKLSVSKRLWGRDRVRLDGMSAAVDRVIRSAGGVREVAEAVMRTNAPSVTVPEYLRAVLRASRGAPEELRRAIVRATSTIEQLKSPELRAAGKAVLRAVETGSEDAVKKQVRHWMVDRARVDAQRLARTEVHRAYAEAYKARAKQSPLVRAFKWNLSATGHTVTDVCDDNALADPDGLGSGVYKVDNEPKMPAHPNCRCFFTSVIATE